MADLNDYLGQVESLLDDFGNVEYTATNLTAYINYGRLQIAGASESIRAEATLALAATTQSYPFTSAAGLATGVGGVLSVRMGRLQNGGGGWARLEMRPWEYFFSFRLCRALPVPATPTMMAQLNPGVAGTLWFDPTPDQVYSVSLDVVGYPIDLVDNTTVEALPYPWTEAVQYYAAYLALLNAQRSTDAQAMWNWYLTFEDRATQISTPSRLPRNFPGGAGARGASQNSPLTGPPPGRK